MELLDEIIARQLYHQSTDQAALAKALNQSNTTFYCGFDPTADSLHIGSFLPLLTMRRLQLKGHKPIAIVGGATGMIGDPSGKSQERNLLDENTLAKNLAGIQKVIEKFLDFSGPNKAMVLNNADWFKNFGALDYLRDVGKFFTVNYMLAKDSVALRTEDREHGISYTEFSYMILQAYDFYMLNKKYNCTLQIGGSDQWGNMTAGTELIRKKGAHSEAHVMTFPLVTKADGTKFGKTESGSVWLTADRTSPYHLYQFLLNTADADAIHYLKIFTFLDLKTISEIESEFKKDPGQRLAQKTLAQEVTTLVHGKEELSAAQNASKALFGSEIKSLSGTLLKSILDGSPSSSLQRARLKDGMGILDALVEAGLCQSKGAAKREVVSGGIYLNNERVTDSELKLNECHLIGDSGYLVLRRGKKNLHLIIIQN